MVGALRTSFSNGRRNRRNERCPFSHRSRNSGGRGGAAQEQGSSGMTDSPTTVSAAPFVAIAAPFINSIVTALVGIAATWFAVQYHRWTGHAMAQADQDKLRQAAQDEAAVIFAGAEAGISATSINVG